jgi:outer membrane protein
LIGVKALCCAAAHDGARTEHKRKKMKLSHMLVATATTFLAASAAMAQSAGDMTLGLGLHWVEPSSDTGALVNGTLDTSVDGAARPTFTFEYFVKDNIGVEVLAALPFQHDASIAGLGVIGKVKHLPPVVSVQYHFATASKVTPFVGVGLNYTAFFDETATGALAGNDLDLEDSWGLAAHAGIDYALSEKAALRADLRYIDIDSDVKLNGTKIGTLNIDPLVAGVAYVMKF